jgi:peroxiredoxin
MSDLLPLGSRAPDFDLQGASSQGGVQARLKDFLHRKNVVLAFYPGDNTSG